MNKLILSTLIVATAANVVFAESITATNGVTIEKTGTVSCESVGIGAGGGNVIFDQATVTASGTLTFTAGNTGRLEFRNGTHAEFAGRTFFGTSAGASHATIAVIDSYLKPAGSSNSNLGNDTPGAIFVFAFTNSTFFNPVDLFAYGNTEFAFRDSVFTNNAAAQFGVGASTASSGKLTLVNSTYYAKTRTLLAVGARYDAVVSGGTFTSAELHLGGYNSDTTSSGDPRCTMVLTNGAAASVTTMYIAGCNNGTATLTVGNGAVLTAGSLYTGGGLIVGSHGAGTLEINEGGTLKAWSVRGGSGTSTFKVNGGTFFVRGYRPSGAHDVNIFENIGTIVIGEKGMVVDTDGWNVTITQSLMGGPVTFAGGGTVTIAAGVTVENPDVTGGTMIVYTDAGTTETIARSEPGIETRANDIIFNGNDTRIFDIASGSGLNLTGKVGIGALVKNGGGILTLNNAQDKFIGGMTLNAGTLAFGENAPARLNANFVIGNTTANTLTVIKADEDLVMNFPSGAIKGAFMKRGTGNLVWERAAAWAQYNDLTAPNTPASLNATAPLDFGDGTTLPSSNFGAFTVAEGRFTIRGASAARNSFRSLGVSWLVGTPVTACAAPPELVLEHLSIQVGNTISIASALAAGSPVVAPKVILKDTDLQATFAFGLGGGDAEVYPSVLASNSTITSSSMYYMSSSVGDSTPDNPNVHPCHRFEAGSVLYVATRVEFKYWARAEFDHSTLAGSATTPVALYFNGNHGTNTLVFSNGSRFGFANAVDTPSSGIHVIAPQRIFFDNATMEPMTTSDVTYDVNTNHVNLVFVTTGKGLVFSPVEGQTITMTEPITGTGGFVNRGAGTSILTNGAVAYAGVTRAESGAIDFAGQTLVEMTLTGSGAFKNGTLGDTTLALSVTNNAVADAPLLDFANNLVLTGKVEVDLGISEEHPLVKIGGAYPILTVATYTGAAPNVSGWMLKKGQGIAGTFSAADGVVTCATRGHGGTTILFQ